MASLWDDRGIRAREVPLATGEPFQTRAMDREDIRKVRRWHRDAALRARTAGPSPCHFMHC